MDKEIKYGYQDVKIVPAVTSSICHRSECECLDANGMLPIFTAPMSSVVSLENATTYYRNHIYPIIPRSHTYWARVREIEEQVEAAKSYWIKSYEKTGFVALSLAEASKIFLEMDKSASYIVGTLKNYALAEARICIDLAHGHMEELLNVIKSIKAKWGSKVVIMSGNIGNPLTYYEYEAAGCDYVRCSIGTGKGCLTSSNVGVHYPPFSLIKEVWEIKEKINGKCKIIADGGIRNYDDIQKALVYADYVMIGSLFNKAIESSGVTKYGKSYWHIFGEKVMNPFRTFFSYGKKIDTTNPRKVERIMKRVKAGKLDVWKEFYGMSTKKAQTEINPKADLKTSEGIVTRQKVEYTLKGWVENEQSYLTSAMSYQDARNLSEYKNAKWIPVISLTHNQ